MSHIGPPSARENTHMMRLLANRDFHERSYCETEYLCQSPLTGICFELSVGKVKERARPEPIMIRLEFLLLASSFTSLATLTP